MPQPAGARTSRATGGTRGVAIQLHRLMTIPYRLNAPRFAAESFENEVVVLDVEGGVYYSLEGAAAWLFQSLAAGAPLDHVLAHVPDSQVEDARDIARRLLAETILVPADGPGETVMPPPSGVQPPRMTRFDDLQLLLQIDPVHDVDATGWPNPPAS
jgi:hypothetical protein